MIRGSSVFTICPKPAPMVTPGTPKFGWFSALKNSARNWADTLSTIANSFDRLKSRLVYPGPRRIPTPEFPKIVFGTNPGAPTVAVVMGWATREPSWERYLDWTLDDPAGQGIEAVRPIRDEIERRVRALISELLPETST